MSQSGIGKSPYTTLTGITAPTVIPQFIGQIYVDTSTANAYVATGTAGIYNWGFIGKGSTSLFNATTIPGIVAWFDAMTTSSMTIDGSNRVTTWSDISGNGRHLTQSNVMPTNFPVYTPTGLSSKPTVFFDGALSKNMYTQQFAAITQPTTWCVVMQPTNPVASGLQCFHDGAYNSSYRNLLAKRNGEVQSYIYSGGEASMGNAYTNNPEIRISCFNGASSYQVLNGNTQSTGNPSTGGLIGLMFGGDITPSGFGYVKFSEMIVYNRALSDVEINAVRTYFNNKWTVY